MTTAAPFAQDRPPRVLVMGAGSIGCFVGGSLAAAGADVTFVGRQRIVEAMRAQGLRLTDLEGLDRHLEADRIQAFEDIPAGLQPDLVLLTVKSAGTPVAAAQLNSCLPAGTPLLTLQNGVAQASVAAQAAPALAVSPGMVAFNVAQRGAAWFHRGTEGAVWAPADGAYPSLAPLFARAGIAYRLSPDMPSVLWGKLLLNLNNPVNAASGLPLRAQLLTRAYRQCLAALMQEALSVCDHAGIQPVRVSTAPVRLLPYLLRLPDAWFRAVAAKMLRIDDQARSSMADDLAAGRVTEIRELCGAVVRLAQQTGTDAPINQRMVDVMEGKGPALPVAGEELLRFLRGR